MSAFDDLLKAAPKAPGPDHTPFRKSIIQQESGKTGYSAIGPVYKRKNGSSARMDLGEIALGKHQIVPKFWFDKLGLDPTNAADRQKFLNSPELQDLAFDHVIADGERRYPGDTKKQAAAYYGGAGGVSILGTPEGDAPQSSGMPSVNSYAGSVTSRIPDDGSGDFESFLTNAPRQAADAPEEVDPYDLQAPEPKGGFESFLASAPRDPKTLAPSLDTFQQQGPINLNQPQPVAKGLPALQPAQAVQGAALPPSAPVPFTSVPPSLTGYQAPQKPSPQENLQAMGDRMPISSQEIGTAMTKGAVGAAVPGLNIPMTERETQSGGQYLGAAAGGLGAAFAGPLAIPAMMATSGLGAVARGMDTQGQVQNPMEVGIQAALGAAMAAAPAAVGQNMIARVTSGGGIGAIQGLVQEAANKMMQEGRITEEDLKNPEVWKQIGSSTLTGMMFGAHGGGAPEAARPAEVQHPGEMAQPIPEQPTFADQAAGEALKNTQTEFSPYKFDPEGRQEQPISVAPEQPQAAPEAQAGNFDMSRQSFLNEAARIYGPEKAKVVQEILGAYLPGGKNAGKYGVRLQEVQGVEPQGASASDLMAKNSSSSIRQPSSDMAASGGGNMPGTPDAMANDPLGRTNTWTGNDPTRQNVDRSEMNQESGVNEGMSDNVSPAEPEVKPLEMKPFGAVERPNKAQTLGERVRSIVAKGQKIYLDDNTRAQLGFKETGIREYGPMFTKDKRNGITLDGLSEIIREQAENQNDHYPGVGHGRNVQANDIVDALFAGGQDYARPTDKKPDHFAATNDILRGGSDQFEGMTPTPARSLGNAFEAGGMTFNRVKSKNPERIAYKDEYGGEYDFSPDDQVHTGGQMKPDTSPKETAAATTEEPYDGTLFQKGPPKASQEDMFGNKGRVASEGFIKGKGDDKGLEGTPLFEGEKREEQAKAEEDQQRLFQTAETAGLPDAKIEDAKALEQAARLWKEKGTESPHFRKWFGKSKVVNPDGEPLRVFHGTVGDFEAFSKAERGSATKASSAKKAFFFTKDPTLASDYAGIEGDRDVAEARSRYRVAREELESFIANQDPKQPMDTEAHKRYLKAFQETRHEVTAAEDRTTGGGSYNKGETAATGANVMPAYLKLDNPLVVDYGGSDYREVSFADHLSAALKGGHDGAIFKNARDAAFKTHDPVTDLYAVFEPNQVKSASGNRGTFDPKSESMLHQGKPEDNIKGYTDFDPAKKEFVISLVKGKADISTLFHEMFHYLEQGGIVSASDRTLLTKALEAYGIKDSLKKNGVFNEAGAEKVADWWERYLRDGKSPVKELQGLFDKVRDWMIDVYRTLKGSRLEGQVPKSVRSVFDRIIEGGREGADTSPDGERLAQRANKPRDQVVGPNAPRNQATPKRDDFMIMEAKAGAKESGYLSNPEKLLFGAADRTYPIKKLQKIYEEEFKFNVDSDADLKYAINRIYGAAGSADHYITKNLAPAIEGGQIGNKSFERLQPAESKRLFEYLLSRDALWRYENTESYEMPNNLPKKLAEEIQREHRALTKSNPALFAKLEKAGDAMVDYARELAMKKLEIGLWTPEEFKEITKNPFYVPEIRYWAKTLATGKKTGAGLDFATRSKLVRGQKASGENVPVFDPLTSLIHDTHQLAKEGAKHYLGNAIIDMQESSPELQKLITEQEDDYKPKAHEGTFPVRRPRQTVLTPEKEAFAERYQSALRTIEMDENSTGTSGEDLILQRQRKKIEDRIAALPPNKRRLLSGDVREIMDKVEANRLKWNQKRIEDARKTEEEFRKLPPEEQKIIKRWMKEGLVTNYTVPIELAEAMNAMEPIQYGTLGKILKGTTTIFKKGTVTWNPGFAMVNGMRDVQEAYHNTGMPPHYAFKGWLEFMRKGDLYEKYLERGGAIGNSESGFKGSTTRSSDLRYGSRLVKDRFNKVKDPEAWKNKKIKIGEKEYDIGKLARMAEAGMQAGTLPMDAMEAFGHMSEMSTRLGVMKYAMEKLGKNVDEAVDMARHATLDFDQRGASLNIQRAMDVVPFLNPRIQGVVRTGKRLMDGKKAAATMAIGGLAPMLGLTALNMMNPNYANVSDRDKRYSWVIMVPGQEKPILIPKPASVQVLFNPFQMALESAVGTSHTSARQQAIDGMQEILPVSDPSSILPPLAKAVVENKINKDIYWNRPIVKEPGREDVDQYDARTSATMKRVGEALNWLPNEVAWLRSPERLQHISKTMLGGTADNLLFLTDLLVGDPKKVLRADRVPVVSRFYKGAEEWQGELAQKQRELISAIKLKERSAGSSTEAMQASRKGEELDTKAMGKRIHHTADAMKDKFRELGEVNKEIARVHDLIQAVKDKNPDVEYRFLRPPKLKSQAPPAPSDAIPEGAPSR